MPVRHDERQGEPPQHALRGPYPLPVLVAHLDQLTGIRKLVIGYPEIGGQPPPHLQRLPGDARPPLPQAGQLVADATRLDLQLAFLDRDRGGCRVNLRELGSHCGEQRRRLVMQPVDLIGCTKWTRQAGRGERLIEAAQPLAALVAVLAVPFDLLLKDADPSASVALASDLEPGFLGPQLGETSGMPNAIPLRISGLFARGALFGGEQVQRQPRPGVLHCQPLLLMTGDLRCEAGDLVAESHDGR